MSIKNLFLFTLSVFLISGCARVELASHFGKKMMGSKVKTQGYYKVGSPYKIKGKKYYPAVDYGYNKKGIASWYGPNFHGKLTANGERYNQNDLTAAHKTLPLPSIVRVTNLENGKSLIVRVNDRGPYAHGRIIDMSKRAAELLAFKNKGIAKVRVQVLEKESRMVAEAAKSGRDTRGMEIPMNSPSYKFSKYKTLSNTSASKNIQTSQAQAIKANTVYKKPKLGAGNAASYAHQSYQAPAKQVSANTYSTVTPPEAIIPAAGAELSYVQTGAFSTREAAMKYASVLGKFGRAQIQEAIVNGRSFYRVRFPVNGTQEAETLVTSLRDDGYENAMIVVD